MAYNGYGLVTGRTDAEDIWKVATDLQRARHLGRRSSQPAPVQNFRRDSIIRELMEERQRKQEERKSSRRGSDADDINWIQKYKNSDHHTDRLVNTKLEALTRSLSSSREVLENQPNGRRSAFSAVAPTYTPANHTLPPKPFRYEGTNKLTVFLQGSFSPQTHRNFSPTPSRYSTENRSKFTTETNPPQSYRQSFARAPSLPPNLPFTTLTSATRPSSLASSEFGRKSIERQLIDSSKRRASLATASDLSAPNYRRSLDFGAFKNNSDSIRSPYTSTFGSDFRRRSSYDTLSSLSSLSPLSPPSPYPSYALPPPSERIFGTRSTHSSMRRNRNP